MHAANERQADKFVRWSSYFSYAEMCIRAVVSTYAYFILANFLTKDAFGVYNLLVTILFGVSTLTFAGIEQTLTRFGSEYVTRGRPADFGRLLIFAMVLRCALLAAVLGLGWWLLPQMTVWFDLPDQALTVLPVFVIVMVCTRVRTVLSEGFLPALQMQFVDKAVCTGLSVLRAVGFTYLFVVGGGLWDVVVIWALLEILVLAVIATLVWRQRPDFSGAALLPAADRAESAEICRFAGFSWLSNLAGSFKDLVVDNIFIVYFLSVAALGPYGIASKLVTTVLMFNPLVILRSVLLSHLVRRYYESGQDPQFVQLAFRTWMKLFFFTVMPIYCVFMIFVGPLVHLLFPVYPETTELARILLTGLVFLGATYTFSPFLSLYKKMGIVFASNILSVLNIVLNIVLVQLFGLTGVATATAIVSALHFPFYAIGFRFFCPVVLRVPAGGLIKTILNAVPTLVVGWVAVSTLPPLAALCVGIPAGLLAYGAMCLSFPLFDDQERAFLAEIAGRYRFRFGTRTIMIP